MRSDPAIAMLLLSACLRQDDQARIVIAAMDQASLLGVADHLHKLRTSKADVTADALSSPPGTWVRDAEMMQLDDERGGALQDGFAQPR